MNKKNENIEKIKLFGLSNIAYQTELSNIEKELGLHLWNHEEEISENSDDIYYSQFEESVRNEASSMARYYEIFYCLEKSIRGLIEGRLKEQYGNNWWTERVPPSIITEVDKRIQQEVDSAVTLRSTNPIAFTTFGELGEIIKANWDIFGDTFNSIKAVQKVMSNLNTLRGPIAHCSLLHSDETIRLQLSLRDWFRLME